MTSYILREWFVTSGMHLILMACGVTLSFPALLAPALTGDHPDIVITEDELNSILGVYGVGTLLGFMVTPMIMQTYGRKVTNIIFCICLVAGSVTTAMATSATHLIIGRAIHGLALAAHFIGAIMIAEYTHPKRRGFHIIIKGVSGGFGELLCHSLGMTVLTYRQVALMAIIPAILSILVTLKWPESPQFLAYKGRYDECITTFEWMRGTDAEAKKELQELILCQKDRKKRDTGDKFTKFRQIFCSKAFWMPMFILFWLDVAWQCSGFLFMASYATEMIYKVTGDRNQAYYYSLLLDCLKMLSLCVSSVLVTLVKRRTLLFKSGFVACVLMAAICAFYYVYKAGFETAKWLTLSMFIAYYVIINVAVAPLSIVIQGEMIPLSCKGVGTFVSGSIMLSLACIPLSATWKMISVLDIHGTFGVFLLLCSFSYVVLYNLLPETKDRTLQDIDNEFTDEKLKYNAVNLDSALI